MGLLQLARLLLALAAPCMAAEAPGVGRPILVGGDRDYPPYGFLDKDGQPAGFNVDLTRAIAEVMGMRVEFRLDAWAGMRQALMAGTLDILPGMSVSSERAQVVDFAPHAIVNHAIFARRKTPAVASLDELAGHAVVVHNAGLMHDILAAKGFERNLILTDTPADALRLLDRHREADGDFTLSGIAYGRMRQQLPAILDDLHEGALRIKRIVNDLKAFARQEEGASKALVDGNDTSRKAVRLLENTIRKCTDRFSTRYEADLPMVWANSQRIEQVVVNRVLKACRHLPAAQEGQPA